MIFGNVHSKTMLEEMIEQTQHFFMRLRAEYVLDTIAKEVKDPLIVSHWNALNSPTQSCVKITIITHGYEVIGKSSLIVHVGQKSMKCVCRDGKVMHLSYEPQELRDLIFCQVCLVTGMFIWSNEHCSIDINPLAYNYSQLSSFC